MPFLCTLELHQVQNTPYKKMRSLQITCLSFYEYIPKTNRQNCNPRFYLKDVSYKSLNCKFRF